LEWNTEGISTAKIYISKEKFNKYINNLIRFL